MVKLTTFDHAFYHPKNWPGLEELVRFPDGEFKRKGIPNSTIWVFQKEGHQYQSEIHASDLGCGMSAYMIPPIDSKSAANIFLKSLKKKNLLGRGNHFVDICGMIESIEDGVIKEKDYNILLAHTHGHDNVIPSTLPQALAQQEIAGKQRMELAESLLDLLGVKREMIGDWPHNTVEETDSKVIYRKGVVKVQAEKLYILPAHLAAKILVYTVPQDTTLPYSSMPHATGRSGPRGAMKVTEKQASLLRKFVYIPSGISNSSLRSEHPSCYNGFEKVFDAFPLSQRKFISVGEMTILSYVGKV